MEGKFAKAEFVSDADKPLYKQNIDKSAIFGWQTNNISLQQKMGPHM